MGQTSQVHEWVEFLVFAPISKKMGAPMPHSTVLDLLEFQLLVPCEPFARNLLPLCNSLLSLPCNFIKFWRRTIDCERQVVHNCKKSKIVHELNGFALEDASSWFADRQRTWELKWVLGRKMSVRTSWAPLFFLWCHIKDFVLWIGQTKASHAIFAWLHRQLYYVGTLWVYLNPIPFSSRFIKFYMKKLYFNFHMQEYPC